MLWRVDKPDAMFRGGKKFGASGHGFQDAGFAFLTQLVRLTDCVCNPLDQRFRLMGVELSGDEDPSIVRGGRDCPRNMGNEVLFRARRTNAGSELFSGRHLEVGSQALRAVTNVFVFLPFGLARLAGDAGGHRFCGRGTCKGLTPSLFVCAHEMNTWGMQRGSLVVKLAHRFDLLANLFRVSVRGMEPVLTPLRFEIGLILNNARHLTGRGLRQVGVCSPHRPPPLASSD